MTERTIFATLQEAQAAALLMQTKIDRLEKEVATARAEGRREGLEEAAVRFDSRAVTAAGHAAHERYYGHLHAAANFEAAAKEAQGDAAAIRALIDKPAPQKEASQSFGQFAPGALPVGTKETSNG